MRYNVIFLFVIIFIVIFLIIENVSNRDTFINKKYANQCSEDWHKLITRNKISKRAKVNFLHIPKNAGLSISKMYNLHDNYIGPVYHPYTFPKKDYINFAIIRNPETRLQSIFAHVKDRDNLKTSYDLNEFNTLNDLANAYYNKNDKNHNKARQIFEWDTNKFNSYEKDGCSKTDVCIHWCPQYFFVFGHEAQVDFLLKFENLNNDLKKLIDLGILENKKLIHKNKSKNKYKKLTYLTPICKKLVRDIYKKDFDLWEKSGLN